MATATKPSNADIIVWKRIHGKSREDFESFSLFSDGGSHIVVRRNRKLGAPKSGWMEGGDRHFKVNPLSKADAKKKFTEAIAAGIDQLKTFPADHGGGVIEIYRRVNRIGTLLQIPEFYGEGEKDNNKVSENHRRFLAVK